MHKARAVARQLGHSEGESSREYGDWHLTVKAGPRYVSVWSSDGMVFMALLDKPIFYRAGVWEQHLDHLWHRTTGYR